MKSALFITLLLLAAAAALLSSATAARDQDSGKTKKGGSNNNNPGVGPVFGPGGGFGSIPGYGGSNGWGNMGRGYWAGFGGVVRPSVVCTEKGPCYKKKLKCPAKCFTSYSRSGKNYGEGGGGGGCTMDCKKKCIAYC